MENKQKSYTFDDEERVVQAIGRAYTHKEVGNTVVDPTLGEAIASEILEMPEFDADSTKPIFTKTEVYFLKVLLEGGVTITDSISQANTYRDIIDKLNK